MKSTSTCGIAAGLFLSCAISFCTPLASVAAPITVPSDLNPGDTYRLVFVTSTTRDATSSNIADYNNFVSAAAAGVPELAALGTTWKAIASTAPVNARDNTATTGIGVPIYRLDDTRIADDNADLWDGNIDASISIEEHGLGQAFLDVWTGTQTNGFWSSVLGGPSATYGYPTTHSHWVDFTIVDNFLENSLYAMSGELTVVPEPGTIALACIGATAVVGWQLHRRRKRMRLIA